MPVIDKAFGEDHTAPRGGKFYIGRDANGLYFIQMRSGGVAPKICEHKFTSLMDARRNLNRYFDQHPEVISRPQKKSD